MTLATTLRDLERVLARLAEWPEEKRDDEREDGR
jgi:hypothetical protein